MKVQIIGKEGEGNRAQVCRQCYEVVVYTRRLCVTLKFVWPGWSCKEGRKYDEGRENSIYVELFVINQ